MQDNKNPQKPSLDDFVGPQTDTPPDLTQFLEPPAKPTPSRPPVETPMFGTFPEPVRTPLQFGAGYLKQTGKDVLGLLKLAPGTGAFHPEITSGQKALEPNPLSKWERRGGTAAEWAEWLYPMSAELKAEKYGTKALEMIPGLAAKMAKGGSSWGWARPLGLLPRAASQAGTGALVGAAQEKDALGGAVTGGAMGFTFGGAGRFARERSAGMLIEARKRLEQAMGAVTPEDVIKARPIIDIMMKKVPFFWSRRGMYNWVAETVNDAAAGRAAEEAPIANIWGEAISKLRGFAKGEVGGRSTFSKVPGYKDRAPISSEWSKEAGTILDKYLGEVDPALKPQIEAMVKAGATIDDLRAQFPGLALGDATYQAVRRGITINMGDYILPYDDMVSMQHRVGTVAAAKKAFTTKTQEAWGNETIAPLMGIQKAVAESIRGGQPKIAEFNKVIAAGLKALEVLDPALEKALPQQEGMKILMGGGGNAVARVAKLGYWHFVLGSLHDFTNSSAWRTTGAVWRASLARSFERGDVEKAGRMIFAAQGASLPKFQKGPFKKVTAPKVIGEEY